MESETTKHGLERCETKRNTTQKKLSELNTNLRILTQHDAKEQMSKRKFVKNTDKLILTQHDVLEQMSKKSP
ncbi:hypothetical protein DPMN_176574 [Dreissena polymorpha]|uniref:Uncharacterized protein n=1 Tax=Dreissena polymorpha TaxID=45954 RepID=A0A9D4II73_DREPO|nr:hypothetical protein DPMN_176574 [Dreissena polymorpha]